jgi:hypothetical protein
MPTKDDITLGPGTLYFISPEGLQPLGEVQAIEFTEEAELDILGDKPKLITSAQAEFSATITAPAETWERLFEAERRARRALYWEFMCDNYPSRRVVHLAKYHGNPRTRKKNIKRICHYYNIKL